MTTDFNSTPTSKINLLSLQLRVWACFFFVAPFPSATRVGWKAWQAEALGHHTPAGDDHLHMNPIESLLAQCSIKPISHRPRVRSLNRAGLGFRLAGSSMFAEQSLSPWQTGDASPKTCL